MTIRQVIVPVVLAMFLPGTKVRADAAPGSPKAAAVAFYHAMEEGNADAARALAAGTDKQLALLDRMAPMVHAFKTLQRAATKKWGRDGEKLTPRLGAIADVSSLILKANEVIHGDQATLVADDPATMRQPILLKKVGGAWKVDMSAIKNEEADAPEAAAMLKGLAEIAQSTAAEIEQGKYSAPEQARAAIGRKMSELLAGKNGSKK